MEEKSVLAPCSRDRVGCDLFLIRRHDYGGDLAVKAAFVLRLVPGTAEHVPHQSFGAVRFASSSHESRQTNDRRASVPDAGPLQGRPSSDLFGFHRRFLGNPGDDGRSPSVCRDDDSLYSRRDLS
jgi:hypothetical protein